MCPADQEAGVHNPPGWGPPRRRSTGHLEERLAATKRSPQGGSRSWRTISVDPRRAPCVDLRRIGLEHEVEIVRRPSACGLHIGSREVVADKQQGRVAFASERIGEAVAEVEACRMEALAPVGVAAMLSWT